MKKPSEGGLDTGASAPVGEVGQSQKTGAVPPRPDLPVGDWIALLVCCLDAWAGLGVCALPTWAEPLLGSQSARDPGFMNPTGAPEPPSLRAIRVESFGGFFSS